MRSFVDVLQRLQSAAEFSETIVTSSGVLAIAISSLLILYNTYLEEELTKLFLVC